MIDTKTARLLFKAARACESDMAAGIAQNVAVGRIMDERDAYREVAMKSECGRIDSVRGCSDGCGGRWCSEVVDAVDSCVTDDARDEIADMLEELGGWPPKRKRPVPKSSDR